MNMNTPEQGEQWPIRKVEKTGAGTRRCVARWLAGTHSKERARICCPLLTALGVKLLYWCVTQVIKPIQAPLARAVSCLNAT
jgi:hypothetical protein